MPDVWNSIDPGNILRAHLLHHRIMLDYVGGSNPIYVGWALDSMQTSQPQWRVCRIDYTGNDPIRVVWAGRTNQYIWKWDDRASLTYTIA